MSFIDESLDYIKKKKTTTSFINESLDFVKTGKKKEPVKTKAPKINTLSSVMEESGFIPTAVKKTPTVTTTPKVNTLKSIMDQSGFIPKKTTPIESIEPTSGFSSQASAGGGAGGGRVSTVKLGTPIEEPTAIGGIAGIAKTTATNILKLANPVMANALEALKPQKVTEEEAWKDKVENYWRIQRRLTTFKELGLPEDITTNPKKYISKDYKEPDTIGGTFLEGLKSGYYSTIKPSLGFIVEALGRELDLPSWTAWGEKQADTALAYVASHPELFRPDDLKPFFEGGVVDPRWYARTIGETVPFMAVVMGSSVATAIITKSPQATYGVAYVSTMGIEQANAYQDMIDRGINPEKAAPASTLYGAISAFIENAMGFKPYEIAKSIGIKGLAKEVVVKDFKDFLLKQLPKYGIEFLNNLVGEASEEAAQQFAQNLITKWLDESQPLWEGVAESAAGGFFGALPLGAINVIGTNRYIRQQNLPGAPVAEEEVTLPEEEVTPPTGEVVPPVTPTPPAPPTERVTPTIPVGEEGEIEVIEPIIPEVQEFNEILPEGVTLPTVAEIVGMTPEAVSARYADVEGAAELVINQLIKQQKAYDKALSDLSESESRSAEAQRTSLKATIKAITDRINSIQDLVVRENVDFQVSLLKEAVNIARKSGLELGKITETVDELGKGWTDFRDDIAERLTAKKNAQLPIREIIGQAVEEKKGEILAGETRIVETPTGTAVEKVGVGRVLTQGAQAPETTSAKFQQAIKTVKDELKKLKRGEVQAYLRRVELGPITPQREAQIRAAREVLAEPEARLGTQRVAAAVPEKAKVTKKLGEKKPKAEVTGKKVLFETPKLIKTISKIKRGKEYDITSQFLVRNGKLIQTAEDMTLVLNTTLSNGMYKVVDNDAIKSNEYNVEDYPIIDAGKTEETFQVTGENLAEVLKNASAAISKSGVRDELNGVYFNATEGGVEVAATDSYRLYFKNLRAKFSKALSFIMKKPLQSSRVVEALGDRLSVKLGEEAVEISGDNGSLTVNLARGEYPDFKQIYGSWKTRYTVDTDEFKKALKELKPFVRPGINDVNYEFADGNLILTTRKKGDELYKEIVIRATPKEVAVKPGRATANEGTLLMPIRPERDEGIKFNVDFMLDALKVNPEDITYLYFQEQPGMPALVSSLEKLENEVEKELTTEEIPNEVEKELTAEEIPYDIGPPQKETGGAPGASFGTFADGTPVMAGSLNRVLPIKLPELITLVNRLKSTVRLNRRLRAARGRFKGGEIQLNPNIFNDTGQAEKTLAHEIGHLVDWLPDMRTDRGNIVGRIYTLTRFLKNTFGEEIVNNKEIRDELWTLSKEWRPVGENPSSSYLSYRKSAAELYADAISVLLNSPGYLEEKSPNFYKAFFDNLDKKPEVMKEYFTLQEELQNGVESVVSKRRVGVVEMFKRADIKAIELQHAKNEEIKKEKFLGKLWSDFKRELFSIHTPWEEKIKELEKRGVPVTADENPVHYLNEQSYLGGEIKAFVEDAYLPVFEILEQNGITKEQLGEMLFYERVLYGDRGQIANPGGYQPEFAEEMLGESVTGKNETDVKASEDSLKAELGEARFNLLKEQAQKFRSNLKSLFLRGYEEGLYKDDLYRLIAKNDYYIPFKTQRFMDKRTKFTVQRQGGTLSDIENPVNTAIEKSIAMIRAIERNKATRVSVDLLRKYFPEEIQDAKVDKSGGYPRVMETYEKNRGTITYLEKGKVTGFYVDKYIAQSVKNETIGEMKSIVGALRFMNGVWFKPVFTGFNLGFQTFNLFRDFHRFWRNMPKMTLRGSIIAYTRAIPASFARGFEWRNKLVKEMEEEKVLGITMNDILAGETNEDTQNEMILRRVGLGKRTISEKITILRPLTRLLNFIADLGNSIESLPKVAAYLHFKGLKQEEMLSVKEKDFIRRFVGSPDFLMKGNWTRNMNNIFLFSNAIIQGLRADAELAVDPTTASGFWWKQAKITLIPKFLMMGATLGFFGALLKEVFNEATEYDKTNYVIVPFGKNQNGKAVYLRVPQDETSRFIGAILWKGLNVGRGSMKWDAFTDIMSIWGGQLPSLTPSITIPLDIGKFITGQNIYDNFRRQDVFNQTDMDASIASRSKKFGSYLWQQFGGNIFFNLQTGTSVEPKTNLEKVLHFPVLNNIIGRWIKVTDYGLTEGVTQVEKAVRQERAERNLSEKDTIIEYAQKAYEERDTLGSATKYQNELILKLIGHTPKTTEEKSHAASIKQKYNTYRKGFIGNRYVDSLLYSNTNQEKIAKLEYYKQNLAKDVYEEVLRVATEEKVISKAVVDAVK